MAISHDDWVIDGERLKALRNKAHLTQPKLAELSGVSQPMLSKMERGETPGSTRAMQESLARVLHTSSEYLCGQSDDPKPTVETEVVYDTAEPAPDGGSVDAEVLSRELSRRHHDGDITEAERELIKGALADSGRWIREGSTAFDVIDGLVRAVKALGTSVPKRALWTWSATGKQSAELAAREAARQAVLNAEDQKRLKEAQNERFDRDGNVVAPKPDKKPKR